MKNNLKKLFLILIIVLFTGDAYSNDESSHKDLKESSVCTECHTEKPKAHPGPISTSKNISIKDNVTEFCTKCHEYGERSHPTDKLVDFPVPNDLPLKNKMITCATCHYPHGKQKSNRKYIATSFFGGLFSKDKQYKTYYLRRVNTNGELCLACHTK